ncbi:MAG: hypothetical protein K0R54_143 [Clostridiaceae bacterium]|jgi:hypothetical protein|nr:hypothetical protein [Clostridiaceae bacterium]
MEILLGVIIFFIALSLLKDTIYEGVYKALVEFDNYKNEKEKNKTKGD